MTIYRSQNDWVAREDRDVAAAIREAQAAFPDFVHKVEEERRQLGLDELDENDADAVVQALVDAFHEGMSGGAQPGISVSMIQVFFPCSQLPSEGEKLWVHHPFEFQVEEVSGVLYSDSADELGLQRGQRVTFHVSLIVDWVLAFDDDRTLGGFTFRAARRRMSPIERRFFDNQWEGLFNFS